jgi:hypothetical protein
MKIFGIFCRNIFVPWAEIRVQRKDYFFGSAAELKFGNPAIGRLTIQPSLADRLARSAKGHWPEPEKRNLEPGPFPEETERQLLARLTKRWLLLTGFAALLFIAVPRILNRNDHYPTIAIAIIFPGLVFGALSLIEYVWGKKR